MVMLLFTRYGALLMPRQTNERNNRMKNVQDMIAAIHNLNSRLTAVEGVVKNQDKFIKELSAEVSALRERAVQDGALSEEADMVDGEQYVD